MKRARKIFVLMLSCIMLCGITQPIQAASPASLVTVRTDFSDTSVPYAVPVLQYAGTGDTVIPDVVLPEGSAYKVSLTHDGNRNFIVKFYNGDKSNLLANTIGVFAGTSLLERGSTAARTGIFEIIASGNWTLTVSTITNISTKSLSGTGYKVSGLFILPGTNTTVTMNYTGKSNFIVYAHYSNGKSQLLANTIGDYSGQKVLRNPENTTCYLEVKSSGAWTVDLGYGDEVSVVPDIN